MAYEVDSKLTDKVIKNIIKRIEKEVTTLVGPIDFWGLNEFADSSIKYRLLVPVKMDEQFSAERQINKIIKEEYDKENISIPFNIVEVRNG